MKLQELIKAIKKAQKDKTVRLITLEDVLIALTLNGGSRWNMITYKKGKMKRKIQILREDQKKFIIWQLNKTLDKQSPETINFLHALICK